MSYGFPSTGSVGGGAGPLDPLYANAISLIQTEQADEGVGCGPGGPPHSGRRVQGWENYRTLGAFAGQEIASLVAVDDNIIPVAA